MMMVMMVVVQVQLKGIGKTPFSRGGDGKAGEIIHTMSN